MKFQAHGRVQVRAEPELLVIDADGPGNAELLQEYQLQVAAYREQLSGQPWGLLMNFNGDVLLTADALDLLQESIARSKAAGMCAVAIRILDCSCPSLVKGIWDKVYEQAKLPNAYFDDESSARQWLGQQLMAVTE
ncbi:hypothetical protein HMF8227_02619 [Saliniradius amylolyticus]|uniref:STAS/SEC14 domain-containing protein n=1 Tax=Saliniradius amylolyticus TaxID=2183582 RepID=A0A2S2E5Z3_9ALTE|nr:hypothetical protein [Saliniradius amylolyticus]AWL13071.1 hypothetical protein HMF8227_02619 [Saliniradius amylolyticus]